MMVLVFTGLFLGFFFLPFWDLSSLSSDLHQICLERLNFKGEMRDIHQALICGKRLPRGPLRSLFIQGGLIHLTVVSGAHLLFLERFWKKIPLPGFLKTPGLFGLLIVYALASHLHPPVLRALFSFFLFRLSQNFKLFWNPYWIHLLSCLLCLLYEPRWVFSFSLKLSFLAAILQNTSSSWIKRCFFTYLFIFPIVNRWQVLHPLTVLINWTLAPLIGSLLFPLTFLSPFFPPLRFLTDLLWSLVFQALKWVQVFPSSSPWFSWFIPKEWLWFYIALLYFVFSILALLKKRREIYPSSQKNLWI